MKQYDVLQNNIVCQDHWPHLVLSYSFAQTFGNVPNIQSKRLHAILSYIHWCNINGCTEKQWNISTYITGCYVLSSI